MDALWEQVAARVARAAETAADGPDTFNRVRCLADELAGVPTGAAVATRLAATRPPAPPDRALVLRG